jgi:hypothetical protein
VPSTRGNFSYQKYEERLLPDLLPVVVNPQAEIDVIPAQESKTYEYIVSSYRFVDGQPYHQKFTVDASEIFVTANDRANWRYWWTLWEWIGGVDFGVYEGRTAGTLLRPSPPVVNPNLPPLRVDVMSVKIPKPETSIKPLEPRHFHDRRGLHVQTAYPSSTPHASSPLSSPLTSSYGVGYVIPGVEKFDPTASAPMLLTDIIYCWRLSYLYWGDTRYPPGQAYPRVQQTVLSAPVTIRCPLEDPPDLPRSAAAVAGAVVSGVPMVGVATSAGVAAEVAAAFVEYEVGGDRFDSSLLTQPAGVPELASLEALPDPVAVGKTFSVTAWLSMRNPSKAVFPVSLAAIPSIPGMPAQIQVPGGLDTWTTGPIMAPASGSYTIIGVAGAATRTVTLTVK